MPDLTLTRTRLTATSTFGELTRDDTGAVVAVTVEREADGWSNRPSTPTVPGACIAAGIYHCVPVQSPKFGSVYLVQGVPNRTAILFHAGNLSEDSRGCIILGSAYGQVKGRDGVVGSKLALAKFLALQSGKPFTLTIVNAATA